MRAQKNISQRQWGKSEISGGRHAFRISLLVEEISRLPSPSGKALDAGSGDGTLTLELLKMGLAVSAVDASIDCLERLRENLALAGEDMESPCPRVTIDQAVLTDLPFQDNSFDLVVSGEVLEHVEDHQAAAAQIARVMKPGAALVVSVPANPDLFSVEDEWAGHIRRYEKNQLEDIFSRAGLETVRLYHWGWPVTYLYVRLLFVPWLKLRAKKGDPDRSRAKKAASHPAAVRIMSAFFSIDRLFLGLPWGIGLIGVFRKKETPE